MRKLFAAGALGLILPFAACLFPDLSGFERSSGGSAGGHQGGAGAGTNTTQGTGNGGNGSGAGGQAGGGTGGDGSTGGPCDLRSNQKGAKGVVNPSDAVTGRCIATTETSFDQYEEFLVDAGNYLPPGSAEKLKVPAAIKPECAFKDSQGDTPFQPTDYIFKEWKADASDNAKPVQGVDWCDAWIYCNWAGKELCGNSIGNPIDRGQDAAWIETTEWYYACQADTPWPNTPECYPDLTGKPEVGETMPVDSNCVSQGIHHMLSNVWEWENNCVDSGMGYENDD